MAKTYTPQIVTANALLSGDVVFLTSEGWSADIAAARIAHSPQEAENLLKHGAAQVGAIVGAYLVAVGPDGQPIHFRERLRTLGPTTRPDLGYQAWGYEENASAARRAA